MRSKKTSTHHSPSQRRLRIGPAGWSYPDWSGFVYPPRRPKNFHEATFLAQFSNTIEINTSFYQPVRPDHAAARIDRVAARPSFMFAAKLWQRFTRDTFVVTNNHYQGKAVVNALQLLTILKGTKLKVPDDLRPHYPELEEIASGLPQLRHFSRSAHQLGKIDGNYFLKRFSNACRASKGRPVEGGSAGTCAGCI